MEEYSAKHLIRCFACVGISLSFRAVTSQVFSAPLSLTSVFGMGTGGPSASSTPTILLYLFFPYLRSIYHLHGDSCGNRTRVAGVRGGSLHRLTNEPFFFKKKRGFFFSPPPLFGWGGGGGARPTTTKQGARPPQKGKRVVSPAAGAPTQTNKD